VVILAACGGNDSAKPPPSAIAGAPEAVVVATEMRFAPGEVKLVGTGANLTLRDDGGLPHDLTIPSLGVYLLVQPGQTVTAGFKDLPKGTYPGWCGIQGHRAAGMQMDVIVE